VVSGLNAELRTAFSLPNSVDGAKRRRHTDNSFFELILAQEIQEIQAHKHREQPLSRDEDHHAAGEYENGTANVFESQR